MCLLNKQIEKMMHLKYKTITMLTKFKMITKKSFKLKKNLLPSIVLFQQLKRYQQYLNFIQYTLIPFIKILFSSKPSSVQVTGNNILCNSYADLI